MGTQTTAGVSVLRGCPGEAPARPGKTCGPQARVGCIFPDFWESLTGLLFRGGASFLTTRQRQAETRPQDGLISPGGRTMKVLVLFQLLGLRKDPRTQLITTLVPRAACTGRLPREQRTRLQLLPAVWSYVEGCFEEPVAVREAIFKYQHLLWVPNGGWRGAGIWTPR